MKSPKRIAPFEPVPDLVVNLHALRDRALASAIPRVSPPVTRYIPSCERTQRSSAGPLSKLRDERVARRVTVVHHDVPETLRVEQEPRALVEVEPDLGRGIGEAVGAGVHQQHVALGEVGELEPAADNPTRRSRD